MIKKRIAILDGFRALAILSVLFYHFFSRWIPPTNKTSLYPYSDSYNYFQYGYLGVNFFFIISGFVIFFTLENTSDFSSFWKKRSIRLLPPIIVASAITFIIFNLFDNSNLFPSSHQTKNFIPSITFISPDLLNTLFPSLHLNYINGAYWSLWPEIQFYLFSSIIYYCNKDKFIRNFLIISIFLIIIQHIIQNVQDSNKLHIVLSKDLLTAYSRWIENGFNLISYLPFFSIGILFYLLFKNNYLNNNTKWYIKFSLTFLLLFTLYIGINLEVKLIFMIMFLLFFGFIYVPKKILFFENKILTNIGESSYFLYLIHENIGVLIIYSIGQYFLPFGFVLPMILIILLIGISNLYFSKIDSKINIWLKMKLL